ncbi:c-type cytochrome [Desulforhopalus sp. 52FAK]
MTTSKRLPSLLNVLIFLSFSLLPAFAFGNDTRQGANLYLANCAKCHGREGEGFLKLYPPIRNSHYLKENVSKLPCIIRYGLKGEIVVEGVTFNQIMPAIQQLKAEEIDQIIVFLQEKGQFPVTQVNAKKLLEDCENK